jgi:outer membrane protein assembly factor BamB
MIAVDCETGKIIWQSPNPHRWVMTHSSVIPIEFVGKRMYVYCASGGVVGISAEDGSILWENAEWKIRVANVPSPVVAGDGLIFLSGGYNAGSMMLRLAEDAGKWRAETLFKLEPEVFGAEQQTPIKKFGLGPFMIANGLIYAMNDSGLLRVIEATPAGYVQLAEAKVLEGPESWGPMAVAAGRLILRDLNRMICLDITEK